MFYAQESKTVLGNIIRHPVWVTWVSTEAWQSLPADRRVELSYLVPEIYRGACQDANGDWWQPIAVRAWTEDMGGGSYRECHDPTGCEGFETDIGRYF